MGGMTLWLWLAVALAQDAPAAPAPAPAPAPAAAPAPEPTPAPADPVPVSPVPTPPATPAPALIPPTAPAPTAPGPAAPAPTSPPAALPPPAPLPPPAAAAPPPTIPEPVVVPRPDVHDADPAPAPVPAPAVLTPADVSDALDETLPSSGPHGLGVALTRLLVATALLLLANLARRQRSRLARGGALPTLTRAVEVGARLATVAFLLAGIAALLPFGLWPVGSWVVVAAALGLGWSARDVGADLVAGIALSSERKLRIGAWVEGPGFAGTVQQLGLRTAVLRRTDGAVQVVPHSQIADSVLVARTRGGFPSVTMLDLDPTLPPSRVRLATRRALAAVPWINARPPEIGQDPTVAGRWNVTVYLLDPAFAERHVGTLRERVLDELAPASTDDD